MGQLPDYRSDRFFLNTIFTALVAADSVAGEFTWGTIKLLLIRPWSRSKILLSKYISMVLFSLFSTLLLIVFGYGSALIFSSSAVDSIGGRRWPGARENTFF